MTDRKKPGRAFWATVMVLLPLMYVLSFGPACWIMSRVDAGGWTAFYGIYRPMTWAMSCSKGIEDSLNWYARLGSPPSWTWGIWADWIWVDTDKLAPP